MAGNWGDSKHGVERIGLAIFIIITGIRSNRMQQTIMKEHPLDELVSAFLADLTADNEDLTVVGRGNQKRTILLDDPRCLYQLRVLLKRTAYKHGLPFQAEKDGQGGTLRYQSM